MDGDLVLQRRGGFMPEKIAQGLLLAGLRDGRDPVTARSAVSSRAWAT